MHTSEGCNPGMGRERGRVLKERRIKKNNTRFVEFNKPGVRYRGSILGGNRLPNLDLDFTKATLLEAIELAAAFRHDLEGAGSVCYRFKRAVN